MVSSKYYFFYHFSDSFSLLFNQWEILKLHQEADKKSFLICFKFIWIDKIWQKYTRYKSKYIFGTSVYIQIYFCTFLSLFNHQKTNYK